MRRTKEPIKDLTGRLSRRRKGPPHPNGSPRHQIKRGLDYESDGSVPVLVTTKNELVDMTTFAGRYFTKLVNDLIAQRGGHSSLTPAELQLVYMAACLGTEMQFLNAEFIAGGGRKRIDPMVYPTLANTQRRLLAEVGFKRKRRKIDPKLIEGHYSDGENSDGQLADAAD